MLRYTYTFARYWWLLLIPVLALPLAEAMQVRHSGSGFSAGMTIYVQQTAANELTTNNASWLSLAQIEASNITQWLQSPTFCLDVAEKSPLYARRLALLPDAKQAVTTDLQTNVQVTAQGTNLVSIGYSSKDPALAKQVVQSVLTEATSKMQVSNNRVGAVNKAYYQAQLLSAEAVERTAAQQLKSYMQEHGIAAGNLQDALGSDLTLATLYDQDRSDQQAVTSLLQQVQATVAQNSLPASLVNQEGYFVADDPTVSPISTSMKKKLTSIGIAIVLGLLFAGAFLVVMTGLDRTFRRPVDVPLLLYLPVLAVVPYSSTLHRPDRQKLPKPTSKQIVSSGVKVS